jgi:hypothetical protein
MTSLREAELSKTSNDLRDESARGGVVDTILREAK